MFRLTNIFGILITMGSIGLLAQPITSIADLLYLLSSLIGIPLGIWIFLSARTFGSTVEKQEKKTKTAP